MSVASLVERQAPSADTIAVLRRGASAWETGFVCVALFLSTNAVVPLVFNPEAGNPGTATLTVRDPLSHPVWLLIWLFVVAMMFRFGGEVFAALTRNPAIGVICLLALLSTAWSAVPRSTLHDAVELVLSTLLGLYVGIRLGIARLVAILGWITVVILVLSVVFALVLPKYGLDHARGDVWRGVFGTKNELGRMMVIGGVVWAVRTFANEISRLRGIAIVMGFALAGFASGSRTALGVSGLMAAVFVLVWLLSHQSRRWVPIKGFVAMGIAVSALLLLTDLSLLLKVVGADYTLTGRLNIWDAVWSAIQAHPWLGYGFDAFWRGIEGPSLEVWRTSQDTPPHSHNGFLDLLLALGAVGLAAFVVAYVFVWRRALALLHWGQGSAQTFPLVFLSLLVLYNLTESSLVAPHGLEWIVFVAVAAGVARDTAAWEVISGRTHARPLFAGGDTA